MSMEQLDSQEVALETPVCDGFAPPSVNQGRITSGESYSYFSSVPQVIAEDISMECVLGVDEAGRGPVIGPMVYGVFYLPINIERSLLADTHHFDDSKVLTPTVRSDLMRKLCTRDSDLYRQCGWATQVMSARDISAGMLRPAATYNLNAQAMDATVELIKGVFAQGVNIREIYVDTIGAPATYQKKLERVFPTARITVAKKADSLFPCVSAASVCAKVTRDAALEASYESYSNDRAFDHVENGWGSGYPSDARCSTWLKQTIDPVFGWGVECRFSWGTAKDLLETKKSSALVEWPEDDDDGVQKMTDFFLASSTQTGLEEKHDELANWYGSSVTEEVF